jgi:RHS repeat-associated protein
LTGGIDETFLRIEGASRHSFLADGNNNTVRLLDANQAKVVDYTYEPYGRTTADATNGNTQQYTGRENDNPGNAGGLYYYRARYYMPGCARFISEDPIGWASGQTNNYGYVKGNPVSYVDPEGLQGVQPAPMLRPQPQIPGPAGQYPYIRPEWNYPFLPEAQQLTRVCVRTSCPVDQPQMCTAGNPTGASKQWKQGPFISAPGGLSSACVCLEYGWGVGPNPLPVSSLSTNQNSGQPPGMLQRLIRLLR